MKKLDGGKRVSQSRGRDMMRHENRTGQTDKIGKIEREKRYRNEK